MPRLVLACLLLLAASTHAAENVRPFVSGSLGGIVAEHRARPFILAFWSVTCTHCPRELRALAKLRESHPGVLVVLVAADEPEDAPRAAELAARYGLAQVQQWIFADDTPERLRFEIDPRWHGELPRSYFYDRAHRVTAVSGVVPEPQLGEWARNNPPR